MIKKGGLGNLPKKLHWHRRVPFKATGSLSAKPSKRAMTAGQKAVEQSDAAAMGMKHTLVKLGALLASMRCTAGLSWRHSEQDEGEVEIKGSVSPDQPKRFIARRSKRRPRQA